LQPEFWHTRWRTGQIGFHQASVERSLQQHWPALGVPADSRIFVPLCGKSLDMQWLRERGHSVAGVELSAMALESFLSEHGIPARRRTLDAFDVYEAPRLGLYRGDFFQLTAQLLGAFGSIYDRAALIAWTPDLRTRYVEHMTALSTPGTQTLLITVEYPQEEMQGPPFSVSDADVHRLYGAQHDIRQLSRQDILPDEPRLRSRGVTRLHQSVYRLTRL
jgi:thiopurine S-methyltransferase